MRQPALIAAAAAVLVALAAGCGGSANAGGVDIRGLEHELAQVMRLREIAAGSEFDMTAACTESGDALHFSCHVAGSAPGVRPLEWNVSVECRAAGDGDRPRCTSDNGYALQ